MMKGKVAAITGGSGTLGRAFIKGLVEQGVQVFSLDRTKETSLKMVEEFKAMGHEVHSIQCDVLDEESVNNAVKQVLDAAGKIDILVNSAGGNMSGATVMPEQTVSDISVEQFRKVNDLNLLGTVIPTIAFTKPMVEQGTGCIINISSMAAFAPLTFFVAKQNRALLLNEDDSLTARGETIISQTPMKRFGNPEDLVSTLLWLCDDKSSFITGIIVPVDGGYSAFSGV